jgi:hypothetical protein
MKRAAIQLSVNFVIILIIAIIVFSMGLRFAYNIFGIAEEMRENLDRETEAQIEAMLDTGQKVGIPINRAKIQIGDSKVFGLGLLNRECSSGVFTVEMTFSKAVDQSGNLISSPDTTGWIFAVRDYNIDEGDKRKIPLPVSVKSNPRPERGTYAFTVEVQCNSVQYGPIQKIYVEVI